jgi:RNA polymerase sigma factor (sigma-70 family)
MTVRERQRCVAGAPPTGERILQCVVDAELRPGFESLFRREFASVARTAHLILRDRERAEEVAQDAFAALLNKWDKVRHYERPDAWVRRVAIRMAIRQARREVRRTGIERSGSNESSDRCPDPDVAAAIAALAPMQRAAVVLYYWDDRPVAEIAVLLDASESTVKQHLHRARQRLARQLGEVTEDAS